MENLLWFHAFGKYLEPQAFVERLREGLVPRSGSTTEANEGVLGITPSCVYFYLGIAEEQFGTLAVVLPLSALEGEMTPFDSGGLVRHHRPVCDRPPAYRQDYLRSASFRTTGAKELLAKYPGPGNLNSYLDGNRPGAPGPHAYWDHIPDEPIWLENTEYRAWLWEGRVPNRADLASLYKWTCAPEDAFEAIGIIENNQDKEWAQLLLKTFEPGGVGVLWHKLRNQQVAPC